MAHTLYRKFLFEIQKWFIAKQLYDKLFEQTRK